MSLALELFLSKDIMVPLTFIGEQALSKALVASRLCQAMANEAADDDLDVEIYDELTNFGKEFESLAVDLLDYCYHLDDDLTQHLLTAALDNWSRKTCLSLAVIAKNLRYNKIRYNKKALSYHVFVLRL